MSSSAVTAAEEGKALVRRILNDGVILPMEERKDLPPWYDHELVSKGQEYHKNNYFSVFVSNICGLLVVLSVPTILKILVKTHQSSTVSTSYKRYVQTIVHMLTWYQSDLRDPQSKGRISITQVQQMHGTVSHRAGLITQKDLALTQFGFMGFCLIMKNELGQHGNQEGFIHFWRVLGYMMGLDNRYNLCGGDVETTKVACEELAKYTFGQYMKEPPKDFKHMATAMLKGMQFVNPFINIEATLELTRRMCYLPPMKLGFFDEMSLNYQIFVHSLLNYKIVSFILTPILNFNMWLTIYLQTTFPVLAILFLKDEPQTEIS